jgi:hypothetical protein
MDDSREPRWRKWRMMPEVKAWEAVALSLNIEPEKVNTNPHAWMGANHPFDEGNEFSDRLAVLLANLSNKQFFPTPCALNMEGAYKCGVRLSEFVDWCVSVAEWENLPIALTELGLQPLGSSALTNLPESFGGLMLKELKEQKAKQWVMTSMMKENNTQISLVKEEPAELSQTNPNKSNKLAFLIQAANKFWANADRDDRATHPDNATVTAWLMERGYSQTLADKAATIIRPEWAGTGRKPDK